MRSAQLFIVAAVIVAAAAVSAAPPVMTPGMWEITMRTESPAVSEPMTTVVCISKEEAEDPKPPRHKATDDCKVTSGGRSGSILSYAVKCGRKKSESTARFTYNGDQFEGVVEGKTDDGNFRQVYTARRIGDCEEAPTPELP